MGRRRLVALGKIAVLIFIAVALQTLVVSHVTVLGLSVDLFVIFTVIVATSWGPLAGSIFGFAAGIAADIAYLESAWLAGARVRRDRILYRGAGWALRAQVRGLSSSTRWGLHSSPRCSSGCSPT